MTDVLTGRIVRVVSGLYDVDIPGQGRFSCIARGLFRKHGSTPLPGDITDITSVDHNKKTGYLQRIHPRVNELTRPKAANINQAILVFSIVQPDVSFLVADTLLCHMEMNNVKPVICVTKTDITNKSLVDKVCAIYSDAGYMVFAVSTLLGTGLDSLKAVLPGNVTALAGPSGVGKSSLINALFPGLSRETGELSQRVQRGKNTTRTCELFETGDGGYIADTPGFTSLEELRLPQEKLPELFPEFRPYLNQCYYGDCLHDTEHDCAVKERVGLDISKQRYESYLTLLNKNNRLAN